MALERRLDAPSVRKKASFAIVRFETIGPALFGRVSNVDRVRAVIATLLSNIAVGGLELFTYDELSFAFLIEGTGARRSMLTLMRIVLGIFSNPIEFDKLSVVARSSAGYTNRDADSSDDV